MTVSGITGDSSLRVLIVGAGIGGLTAAIALRQQGHRVELFERSRFANEVGAAIHLSPNANGVLLRLGVDATKFGAVEAELLREYTTAGMEVHVANLRESAAMWRHRWLLVHRAHFHKGLKAAAQAPGRGHPAILHTASRIIDVDPHQATVTLENAEVIEGDVLIGADGVHSITRSKLPKDAVPRSSGKNAFRFLIARQQALDDPETNAIARDLGALDMWDSANHRVVIYPCANNALLNFDTLLEVYKDFNPQVRKLLAKADPATLKLWPLLDMDTLPSWVNGRLAVLGDAVHPFLPYRASGLEVYQNARHERATTIQQMTRESSKLLSPEKTLSMIAYIFGHDEFDHSTQVLRKYLWSKNPHVYWRQPIVFGPMPGPRQDSYGINRATEIPGINLPDSVDQVQD